MARRKRSHDDLSPCIARIEKKPPVAQEIEAEPSNPKACRRDKARHGPLDFERCSHPDNCGEGDQDIDQAGDVHCGQRASCVAKCRAGHHGENHCSNCASCQGMNGSAERQIDTECGKTKQARADHQPAITDVQNQK